MNESANLAERIAQGDRAAEEWLLEHFRPRILVFLESRLRDPDTAQELCHDILLAVLTRFRSGQVQINESLAGYVFGVARNMFADHLRRSTSRKTLQLSGEFDVAAPLADSTAEERYRLVRDAVAGLPPLDRKILTMTLVDGNKPAQIAERLQVSSDTVRQRKLRAIRKLANILTGASQNAPGTGREE